MIRVVAIGISPAPIAMCKPVVIIRLKPNFREVTRPGNTSPPPIISERFDFGVSGFTDRLIRAQPGVTDGRSTAPLSRWL
ncbi:unnamed protein product [Macrosiphum euphorbiae]|uniref:Uncharacterized protein n=1 Tax=Macrosiphum euphorbiae TaxID=13131 RepID=A0AAV0XM29_9HEMI|nr:unnamed protein product [Macrosiphum euphorbiae]